VKKAFKISGAVFAAVFYSIAVFLFAEIVTPPVSPVSETQSTGDSISFEVSPSDYLGVPLTQKPGINLFNGATYSGSDFQYKDFSAYLKNAERSISSDFVQYVFQSKNFSIRLRKADLLFPFHYFW
jgi:hypothetical protein